MRFLRKLIGLGMVIVGLPALLAGGVGWYATGHRDLNGAFTADLAPVHSSGPVVVVPDVADLVARHRAGNLLSPARLRVTVASSPSPVLLLLMPADAARRYVDGVARTEVAAIGYASGPQPVQLEDIAGTGTLARLPATGVLAASGTDLVFDPSAQPGRLSLLIVRYDLAAGVDASLVVGSRPGWLDPAARGLLLGGGLLVIGGLLLLFWRTARELTRVVDARRPVEVAVAQAPPRRAPRPLSSAQDVTGELLPVPRLEVDECEPAGRWDEPGFFDELEDEMSDMVDQEEQQRDGIRSRWNGLLRRWSSPPGRHTGSSTVDPTEEETQSPRDRFDGDSPYIYTAT